MIRKASFCVLTLLVFFYGCEQVDFVAPTGSTLTMTAQPLEVNYGGRSTLTVFGTRESGAPLPDGTTIRFTIGENLGTVSPNPAETENGVAIATFFAGSRSGTAQLTAVSGTADATAATAEIVIGDARAFAILLSADPQNLPAGGGESQIRAIVTDEAGNALPGIGVIFDADAGTLLSGGRILRTNQNGAVFDTLTTVVQTTVDATTLNGITQSTIINVGTGESDCSFVVSPSSVVVGQTVFFTDTSTDQTNIDRFLWDFGDGETGSGRTTEHEYDATGTYTVLHTIVNSQGFTQTCTNDVTVTSAAGCADGEDNDGDGAEDFPDDFGCTSESDTSEVGSTECGDGLDNDGDTDFDQDDAECDSFADDDESA